MQVLVRENKRPGPQGAQEEDAARGHIPRDEAPRPLQKPSEKKAREKAEAIRRARKLARKKMQREGLLPMKPRTIPGAGPGGAVAVAADTAAAADSVASADCNGDLDVMVARAELPALLFLGPSI